MVHQQTVDGLTRIQQAIHPTEEQRFWMKYYHDALERKDATRMNPEHRKLVMGKYQRPCEKSLINPHMLIDGGPEALPEDLDQVPPATYPVTDSAKMRAIADFYMASDEAEYSGYFDEASIWRPHGMIVFAENTQYLTCLQQFLSEMGLPSFVLSGTIKSDSRMKKTFQFRAEGEHQQGRAVNPSA